MLKHTIMNYTNNSYSCAFSLVSVVIIIIIYISMPFLFQQGTESKIISRLDLKMTVYLHLYGTFGEIPQINTPQTRRRNTGRHEKAV